MKVLRSLFAVLLLAGIARAGEGFGELTVAQVAARLKEKNFYVFDCNDEGTFAAGHVPGAKFCHYDQLSEKDLPADKKATLVFYCANEH